MALFQSTCIIACVSLTALTAAMTSPGRMTQYCDFEMFQARCAASHEVVVMEAASYGRRATGRCLPPDSVIDSLRHDPRYFGCSADVLRLADRKCSGRRRCDVAIPDSDFERATPCYKDSRKYLEAKYDCVKVVEADRSCVVQVSTSPVHISLSQQWTTSTDAGCGSVDQPWTLRAPTGQHIRVHLLDFTSQNTQQQQDERRSDEDGSSCREYGYVDETVRPAAEARQKTVICGDQRRDKLVVESNSNVIQIVFNRPANNRTNLNFLLRFSAVGCLDVRAPADAWMRRIGPHEVEIGCYMSRQVWVLRCVDNQFVGVIGNCTQQLADYNEEVRMEVARHKSAAGNNNTVYLLAIVAVTAAGLAVCATIICVGLLCLRNQKHIGNNDKSKDKYQRHLTEEDYTFTAANNQFSDTATIAADYNERPAAAAAAAAGMRLHLAASQYHI